jgi:A/G-specific adenine glycosylase
MPKSGRKTTPPSRGPATLPRAARAALRAWYLAHQRALPWRTAPSLYKTVVSEFMLQQTQVATVLPRFARWLEQFPDFAALAAAREEVVVRAWEGLGYYRRARRLHALARALAARPAPPRTPAEWMELPGVGPYTAAAITSIAFGEPIAVVDGNVARVLARLYGDETLYPDGSRAARAFAPAAQTLLDRAHPGDHNQAMMELGATVCTPRTPRCPVCPLARGCVAAAQGNAESLPRFTRVKTTRVMVTRVWIERDGALLLHRRPGEARRLAGICELPDASTVPGIRRAARPLAVKRRGIVNQLITETIYHASLRASAPDPANGGANGLLWVAWEKLPGVTLSGPHRRWIGELREREGAEDAR